MSTPLNNHRFTNDALGAALREKISRAGLVFEGEVIPVDSDGFAAEYTQKIGALVVSRIDGKSSPDVGIVSSYMIVGVDGSEYWTIPGGRMYCSDNDVI